MPIESGQSGMRVVPDLRRQLVPSKNVFELLLVLRAIQKQPSRSGITDAIAKHHVEPESHLVDEIVHVAFQAAIVVTGKQQPLLVIEKYPARKMDGTDTR